MASNRTTKHGRKWFIRAKDEGKVIEYRDEGVFDELYVDDWLHIEQMSDDSWWMRLGDASIDIFLSDDGSPEINIQRGAYSETCGSTTESTDANEKHSTE